MTPFFFFVFLKYTLSLDFIDMLLKYSWYIHIKKLWVCIPSLCQFLSCRLSTLTELLSITKKIRYYICYNLLKEQSLNDWIYGKIRRYSVYPTPFFNVITRVLLCCLQSICEGAHFYIFRNYDIINNIQYFIFII